MCVHARVFMQRDLEIRGAGSLLGADQSGDVNSVGFELYMQVS
jgi:transcription-repair coupling factor (superfamily II helicase)